MKLNAYFFRIFSFLFCFCWTRLSSSNMHCIFGICIDSSRSSSSSNNLLINLLIGWHTSWSETMWSILCNTHIAFITHRQRTRTSRSSSCDICGLGWYLHVAMSLFIFLSIRYDTLSNFELVRIIEVKNVGVIIVSVDILIKLLSIMTIILSYIQISNLVCIGLFVKFILVSSIKIVSAEALVSILGSIHNHWGCLASIC